MTMSLGKAVRTLRQAAGTSQKDLAGLLGISASHLSRVEADEKEPSLKLLREIARAVDAPTGVLLATALLAELPASQQEVYEPIVRKLVAITATANQIGLFTDAVPPEGP